MKRLLLTALCVAALSSSAVAQQSPFDVELKSQSDSVSYAIGVSMAGFMVDSFGKDIINYEVLCKAIGATLDNEAQMSSSDVERIIMEYLTQREDNKGRENKIKSEEFLAELDGVPGIKKTASGLYYSIVTEGEGPLVSVGDKVVLNYELKNIDGTILDSTYEHGEPFEFEHKESGLIKGFFEGLGYARQGTHIVLYIPYWLGYGEHGTGMIEAYSTLIFDIFVESVVKP